MGLFDLNKETSELQQVPGFGQYLASALTRITAAINNFGQNVSVDPTGTLPPPPTVQALTVKTNGTGLVHAVINDSNPIQKNLHYFVEYANEPAFKQPHVVHLGPSRTMNPITLPAQDDNGNPQNFYFRAYSQYPGGHPGGPVHFGGTTPTPVAPGGTQKMTLIPSTGSGTAQATGQEGGSGFGKTIFRGAVGPKRQG